jgi:hypothetical protein
MPGKTPPEPTPKVRRRLPRPRWSKIVAWIAVVAITSAAIFGTLYYRSNHVDSPLTGQQYFVEQTQQLSKLILLPADETPTIVTVKDAAQLRKQAFYAQAQNGDLVFVYKKAQKAILYRPSTQLIINVMPVKVS